MKKNYIIPAARFINLCEENALLADSIGKGEGTLNSENQILSNERTASSSIWGED